VPALVGGVRGWWWVGAFRAPQIRGGRICGQGKLLKLYEVDVALVRDQVGVGIPSEDRAEVGAFAGDDGKVVVVGEMAAGRD